MAGMRIEIRLRGDDAPLEAYVRARVDSSLGPWERSIERLTVCVDSLPGSRRYRCRVLVRPLLPGGPGAQETGRDAYGAVDAAIERLALALEAANPTGAAGRAPVSPRVRGVA